VGLVSRETAKFAQAPQGPQVAEIAVFHMKRAAAAPQVTNLRLRGGGVAIPQVENLRYGGGGGRTQVENLRYLGEAV
jgi:hypothetical protein